MTAAVGGAQAALEHLADALDRAVFATVLLAGPGRRPCLSVTRRSVGVTEPIYAEAGWFWWPWAERIAATDDPLAAAYQVTAALHGSIPVRGQR